MLRYLPLIYLNHNRDRVAAYISTQWHIYQIPSLIKQSFPIKLQYFDMLHKCGFIDRVIKDSMKASP